MASLQPFISISILPFARETNVQDTIVVGAGQSGLAAGYHLQRAGLAFTILEAGPTAAGSWPGYYDNLKLFSPAHYAALPGLPFPGAPDHYPARDEVIAYLGRYARHFDLPIVTETNVERVEFAAGQFRVTTGKRIYDTQSLIAATGSFRRPFVPQLPGQDTFEGVLLHAATYRNPEPFTNQRVIVVGAGNSAIQIAVELARGARVTLATRTPLRLTKQRILGRDIHFWARLSLLERLPLSLWIHPREINKVLDTGVYQAALQAGRPNQRAMFASFTSDGVRWSAAEHEAVDAVIFATGYRPNLPYLAAMGALGPSGRPHQRAGVSQTTPGLYFVGLPAQRTWSSATLRGVGADAAYVVAHLERHLNAS